MEKEIKKLRKSRKDKKICGVCGGIAKYCEVDPVLIRLIWILSLLFYGLGFFAYFITALVLNFDDEEN